MSEANYDLTISEVLSDPMIRAVMRADRVTSNEMRTLLYSTANALLHTPDTSTSRSHAARLLAAPKRRLLSMVHPLASRSVGACTVGC